MFLLCWDTAVPPLHCRVVLWFVLVFCDVLVVLGYSCSSFALPYGVVVCVGFLRCSCCVGIQLFLLCIAVWCCGLCWFSAMFLLWWSKAVCILLRGVFVVLCRLARCTIQMLHFYAKALQYGFGAFQQYNIIMLDLYNFFSCCCWDGKPKTNKQTKKPPPPKTELLAVAMYGFSCGVSHCYEWPLQDILKAFYCDCSRFTNVCTQQTAVLHCVSEDLVLCKVVVLMLQYYVFDALWQRSIT